MLARWHPRPDEALLVLRGSRWSVATLSLWVVRRLQRVEPMHVGPTEIEVVRTVRSHDGEAKAAVRGVDRDALLRDPHRLRAEVLTACRDLQGYVVEDLAITQLA